MINLQNMIHLIYILKFDDLNNLEPNYDYLNMHDEF
jgi:hypothetical protein